MIPKVGTLFDELGLWLGRVFALGEAGVSVVIRVVTIAAALLLGWAVYRIVAGVIHRVLRPLENSTDYPVRVQRARTLDPLLSSAARYLVAFLVGVVILNELGIDVRALLVSAGVVGLAIGLGAQSLIKDVITGFFILFENLVAVGDVIEVGPHTGVVEAVGLRVTKLRKFSGELRIIPNGELAAFGHHTAAWARAVVEVAIAHEQDVGQALAALEEVGRALRDAHPGQVLEPAVAEGIIRLGESDAVLRLHAKVEAQQKGSLELEIRRRIKDAFEAQGILIPAPQMLVRLVPDARSTLTLPTPKEPQA